MITPIESILGAWDMLGDAERRTLCALAWRLVKGQMQYGPVAPKLQPGARDWNRDLAEEVLDVFVYSQFIRLADTMQKIAEEEDS